MKKILLLSLIILLFITELDAQRRNGRIRRRGASTGTIVASFGPAYCFGDPKDSPFSKTFIDGTNADFALGFRQKFANNLSYKATFGYGNYTGSEISYTRNLDFNSSAIQFSVRGEYSYDFAFGKFRRFKPHSIYGFIGAGVISSQISHTQEAYSGIETRTSNVTEITPYGFGYQYDFDNNFLLGAEVGWAFPLSDYLDGLHPPIPSSKSNDILFGISVTLAYKIM